MPKFLDVTDTGAAKAAFNADAVIDPRDFGAVGDGVADDTDALQAAIAAMPKGGTLAIPSGVWTYSEDLVLPIGSVLMGVGRTGPYGAFGATNSPRLKATAAGARIFVDTHVHVQDILIDGGNVAKWAFQSGNPNTNESDFGWLVSKSSWTNVFVMNFTEAAFVLEGTQNAVLTNCTVRNTTIGYWFLHGAANIELLACSFENYGTTGEGVGGVDARAVLLKNDWSDRRLAEARLVQDKEDYTIFSGGGGRDIRFYGGIFEYGEGDYRVELLDGADYLFGSVLFVGTQIASHEDSLAIARIGPNYNVLNHLVFTDTAWAINGDDTKLVIAESGTTIFRNHVTSGSGGRSLPMLVQTSGTARVRFDEINRSIIDSAFETSLYANENYQWQAVASPATVSWNSTKKCMNMTLPNTTNGAFAYLLGQPSYATANGSVTITFGLRNCTGPVRLSLFADSGGTYRKVGDFGDGVHTVVYNMVGDETRAILTSASGSSITAECTFFRVEHGVTAGSTAPSRMSWDGVLKDAANNEWLEVVSTPSAENYVQIANSADGTPVSILAAGDDTNVGIDVKPKGSGVTRLVSGATDTTLNLYGTAGTAVILADGSDAARSLRLSPKGITANVDIGYNPFGNLNFLRVIGTNTGDVRAVATSVGGDANVSLDIQTTGTGVVKANGVTVSTRLTNTAALDFGSINAQSFADLTITVTGAATGDAVALGTPTAAITAGIAFTAWVSATDTVTVRAHNYTAGALDPASGTFRATIIR